MMKPTALFIVPLALTACAATTPEPQAANEPANRCQDLQPKDWYAWLDKMPGPGRKGPTLHITGSVWVTHHGWSFAMKLGPQSKGFAPRQQVELIATPGIGSSQIRGRTEEIKGRFDGALGKYESIIITCQGKPIAEVVPESVY